MKKAIVTGANGFVGHAVVEQLSRDGVEVIALAHSVQKRELDTLPNVRVIPFELKECPKLPDIISDRDADVFYHFAWSGGHGQDRNDTAQQLQNVQWSVDALRAAKDMNCRRFLGVGTIMELETYHAEMAQGNRPGLGYIYGAAKLTAHAMLKSVAATIGIDFVWGMLINAFGEGEFSPRLINRAIFSFLDGESPAFTPAEQNYDFIYIKDAARAFVILGDKGVSFKSYMIGSGGAKPLKYFLSELRDTVAPNAELNLGAVPYTGVDVPLSCFCTDELKADTGFEPQVTFSQAVVETAKWMRRQKDEGGGE